MTKLHYNATQPTVVDGSTVEQQSDSRGNTRVTLVGPDSTTTVGTSALNADNQAVSANGLRSFSAEEQFNGTGWDRVRNNNDITALASAARTATLNSGDLTNYNGRGLHVVLDVTNAGTGSITLTIQAKDALSGQYYTLLAGAAVTTVSTNVYKVYPGLTAAANAVASDILPRTYRILVTHNNANSITYSVGCSVIL